MVGVFSDINDTLTTEGAITPDALEALQNLKDAGLMVIPITGRPVGWSIHFASTWPVDAIVAENGAAALLHNAQESQVTKIYQQDLATRKHNFVQMQRIAQRVLSEIPGTVLAQDSPGRETDIEFDHSEFHKLSQTQIQQVLQLLKQEGIDRHRQQHPHQRLVWQTQQMAWRAVDLEGIDRQRFKARPRSMGVCRRLHQRSSDV